MSIPNYGETPMKRRNSNVLMNDLGSGFTDESFETIVENFQTQLNTADEFSTPRNTGYS